MTISATAFQNGSFRVPRAEGCQLPHVRVGVSPIVSSERIFSRLVSVQTAFASLFSPLSVAIGSLGIGPAMEMNPNSLLFIGCLASVGISASGGGFFESMGFWLRDSMRELFASRDEARDDKSDERNAVRDSDAAGIYRGSRFQVSETFDLCAIVERVINRRRNPEGFLLAIEALGANLPIQNVSAVVRRVQETRFDLELKKQALLALLSNESILDKGPIIIALRRMGSQEDAINQILNGNFFSSVFYASPYRRDISRFDIQDATQLQATIEECLSSGQLRELAVHGANFLNTDINSILNFVLDRPIDDDKKAEILNILFSNPHIQDFDHLLNVIRGLRVRADRRRGLLGKLGGHPNLTDLQKVESITEEINSIEGDLQGHYPKEIAFRMVLWNPNLSLDLYGRILQEIRSERRIGFLYALTLEHPQREAYLRQFLSERA